MTEIECVAEIVGNKPQDYCIENLIERAQQAKLHVTSNVAPKRHRLHSFKTYFQKWNLFLALVFPDVTCSCTGVLTTTVLVSESRMREVKFAGKTILRTMDSTMKLPTIATTSLERRWISYISGSRLKIKSGPGGISPGKQIWRYTPRTCLRIEDMGGTSCYRPMHVVLQRTTQHILLITLDGCGYFMCRSGCPLRMLFSLTLILYCILLTSS